MHCNVNYCTKLLHLTVHDLSARSCKMRQCTHVGIEQTRANMAKHNYEQGVEVVCRVVLCFCRDLNGVLIFTHNSYYYFLNNFRCANNHSGDAVI